MRPLMRDEPHRFRVAPLTVLVDPARVRDLQRTPDADLSYLLEHQVAEADLVCLTKVDVGDEPTAVEDRLGGIDPHPSRDRLVPDDFRE